MTQNKNKTVAVAMSGGVDSTLSAHLLIEQGFHVIGATMKMWDKKNSRKDQCTGCFGPANEHTIEDAESSAKQLGIEHVVVDVSKDFENEVLNYFKKEYLQGRTPNPCVICNWKIKFGIFFDELYRKLSFDHFATGHYAQINYDSNIDRYLLKKGTDITKDQSYFLYSLNQKQLSKTLFPLGNMTKVNVKAMANKLGIKSANRPESQDFAPSGTYANLFEEKYKIPGNFVDQDGNIIGKHKGIIHYTVGQRRGLGLPLGNRIYVTKIDVKNNLIMIGKKENLYSSMLIASNLNWVSIPDFKAPMKISAKIRYRHKASPATLKLIDDNTVEVEFDEPQMSITPGQAVVFYDGDIVIGGGTIENTLEQ